MVALVALLPPVLRAAIKRNSMAAFGSTDANNQNVGPAKLN